MNIKSESGRITKRGRQALLDRAKQLLQERGFNVDDSGAGLIVADLVSEFGIQRRTARIVEAQACRLLRGEAVEAWKPGAGRPQNQTLSPYQRAQLERLKALERRERKSRTRR